MTLVTALALINDCIRIKKMVGMNADYPYSVDQVVEAAMEIKMGLEAETNTLRSELKTMAMQLRAANARNTKYEKGSGGGGSEKFG